ncbi:MAG TPA: transglutaminase-like domain-containing protein [Thermoanaerobaculia bacterium]|nr:transglutaminase-like domain-containing protein [Thermoanaerobaculia bacterium]
MATLIHPAEARRRFREFAEGEITYATLALGALLVALEEYPQLDVAEPLQKLDDLASRVRARCTSGEPPVFRLGHLHREMFDVDKYQGDAVNYYDPRNAFLNEVIERRVGLPLTLSVVFLHVAHAIGLTASGVGLPGHYIVKVRFELNEIYVDPFHGGATLTVNEIAAMLGEMSGGRIRLASEHLRSWDARESLVRLLANLQNMWNRAGELKKAASAAERIAILQR